MKLYIVPHSHIDIEWYWTAQDAREMLPDLFYNSLLPQMERDDKLCFAQDQAALWQMLLDDATQEQRNLILRKVKEGKLEPVGGNYVQPEVQEPCGESFVRQLQVGQKWMEEHLGQRAKCAWHPDVFGQIDQLPQLLRQAGFASFAFMRDIDQADDPEHFPTEFIFEGPDGSRILSHWFRISYVLCEGGEDRHFIVANIVQPENEEQELRYVFRQLLEEDSLQHKTGLAMLPWGGDVYGLKENSDQIKERLIYAASDVGLTLNKEDIVIATPSEFFAALSEKQEFLEVKRCDFNPPMYRQDLRGTYITRIKLKQQNRRAEQALLAYEALCACRGETFADGEALWEKVLFGQFHDTIGGSCLDEAYTAAMERNQNVIEKVAARAKVLLGENKQGKILRVFNPTGLVREDVVRIKCEENRMVKTKDGTILPSYHDGQTLSVLVHLNAYEMAELYTERCENASASQPQALQTEYYLVTIDPVTGDPVGIYDKEEQRQLLCDVGNVLTAREEKDPDMEGALRLTGRIWRDDTVAAQYIHTEETALLIRVETKKQFLGFSVVKTMELHKHKKQIDFTTEILDYTGADLLIGVQFAMQMERPQSIYETPFAVRRGREGLYCAQKWAGLQEDGFTAALLNQGTCAYWTEGNAMTLCLLRAHSNFAEYAKYAAERKLPRYSDGRSHTELASERGDHRFRYSLISGNKSIYDLSAKALQYNALPLAVFADELVRWNAPVRSVSEPFVVTSMLPCEGGILLRGYNASEEMQHIEIEFTEHTKTIYYVNLVNDRTGKVELNGYTLKAQLRPFEIITLNIQLQ